MRERVEGVVLRQIKYSDNGRILNVYTREKGKRAYFLNSSSKKKSGRSVLIAQPFALVELLVTESRVEGKMGRITELRLSEPTLSIRENPAKTSLALFLNEVVYRCIQEEEENEALFFFLKSAVKELNTCNAALGNFHLWFLVELMAHLGIQPEMPEDKRFRYFDIAEGLFTNEQPIHGSFLDQRCSNVLAHLIEGGHYATLSIKAEERKTLLDRLLAYYAHHLPELGNIKSHSVLTAVWLDE